MVGWDADGLPWVVGVPCQPAAAALAAAAPIATTTTATSDRLGTRPLRQCSGSRKLQQKHLHGGSMNIGISAKRSFMIVRNVQTFKSILTV